MSDSNISLARSGRAHYVIRALDREVPSASPTMDDLSSLLAARSLKALVESVDVLPSLLPHTDDHTAIRILQGLDRADAELLSRELPSYTHLAMRRVTARAVERLSGDRVETRPGSTVVAEAVSDWVLARNLLGVTAKLARLSSERDDPMSVAGFELDERLDTWVLTVGFDPFAGAEWERAGSLCSRRSQGPGIRRAISSPEAHSGPRTQDSAIFAVHRWDLRCSARDVS